MGLGVSIRLHNSGKWFCLRHSRLLILLHKRDNLCMLVLAVINLLSLGMFAGFFRVFFDLG